MTADFAATDRILRVTLTDATPRALTPAAQQELDVALFDLAEDNRFRPEGTEMPGPYRLALKIDQRALTFAVSTSDSEPIADIKVGLAPFRDAVEDYGAIAERYLDAVRHASPAAIEEIDHSRRQIHDEGAALLREKLAGRLALDHSTSRRLFTVICALAPGQ